MLNILLLCWLIWLECGLLWLAWWPTLICAYIFLRIQCLPHIATENHLASTFTYFGVAPLPQVQRHQNSIPSDCFYLASRLSAYISSPCLLFTFFLFYISPSSFPVPFSKWHWWTRTFWTYPYAEACENVGLSAPYPLPHPLLSPRLNRLYLIIQYFIVYVCM